MRAIAKHLLEGLEVAAFLIVLATLAPRAPRIPDEASTLPVVPPPPTEVRPHEDRVTLKAEAPPTDPDPKPDAPDPAVRVAIGFDPAGLKPRNDPPPVEEQPPVPVGELAPPEEPVFPPLPPPLPRVAPRIPRSVVTRTFIYGRSTWGPRPHVISIPRPREVLPPDWPVRPARPRFPVGGGPLVLEIDRPHAPLDPHSLRQHWQRDVEQYRLLAKTGLDADALRREFGAKCPAVEWASALPVPLSALPPPPASYSEALGKEDRERP